MVSAWITGTLGAALTYWVGARYFGWGEWESLRAVAASNVAGFFALLATLALERRATFRRIVMGTALKTWAVLAILYTALLAGMDPDLWHFHVIAGLFAPLVLATGFMLPLWGRAQDQVLRWEQRRSRSRRFPMKQQFARTDRNVIRVES